MSAFVHCEPLERRGLFAGGPSAGFDPDFLFESAEVRRIAGNNTQVFTAVPAQGDRTFLLAERYPEPDADTYGQLALLTIVAVTPDGKMDTTFGTSGVALSQRYVTHSNLEPPGLLKVDDAGRVYFSDGKRVIRFRKNGTTDTSFGERGVVQYAPNSRPVQLCDMIPVGDSVYLALTASKKGVQYFAVQEADGRRVRIVFSAADDLGLPYLYGDGSFSHLATSDAIFARSAAGVVMARLESDYVEGTYIDPESGELADSVDTANQTLVVTRFAANGGRDILRMEARRLDGLGVGVEGMLLSPTGKSAVVMTHREILRLNLNARTGRRYDLPGELDPFNRSYDLLSDGKLYVTDYQVDDPSTISRFLITGQPDPTFAQDGVLTFIDDRDLDGFLQRYIYVSESGRLHVTAEQSDLYKNYYSIHRL